MRIQPGARYWLKAWLAERFAVLADRFAGTFGYRALIGWSEQDRIWRVQMGKPGQVSAKEEFSLGASVKKIEEFYAHTHAGRTGPG